MNFYSNIKSFLPLSLLLLAVSCKKMVSIDPPINSLTSDNVFTTDVSAIAVMTDVYTRISSSSPLGSSINARTVNGVSIRAGLSADELGLFAGAAIQNPQIAAYYTNSLSSTASLTMWDEYYFEIYLANLLIEKASASTGLTPSVKKQLIGEAKFIRAYHFFYLVNMYGDVPLTTTTNYQVNSTLPRAPRQQVYQQIITDLKDAQDLLSDKYLKADLINSYAAGSEERIRPTKWAATALLARVYLYTGDWVNAEAQSSIVINNNTLFSLVSPNNVFLKNSKEAIFQLQPVNAGWNTEDARVFVLPTAGPNISANPLILDSINLVKSFEANDLRSLNWIKTVTPSSGVKYYYPYKYKSATQGATVTEYLMMLRLGEQYLIRSEARAQQNNISGAQSDLNAIRNRAALVNTTSNDKASILIAIMHERQVELFTEWGHRWFDLKRMGNVNTVMSIVTPQKGGVWNPNWQWYPIPIYEIQQNSSLIQNPGY